MVRLLLGRLAGLVAVLVAISVMVFVIFNVIPGGDPALRLAGRHPTQQNIRQIRHDWGFDQPLYTQYFDMMNHLFIERDLIRRSLERTGGNRNKAAELLRIKRTTLVEKLKRQGE